MASIFIAWPSAKDWADLLHAGAWPIVALVAIFRFGTVIESLLERVVQLEGLGLKATLAKLDKELPKAEGEARKVRLPLPRTPKPRE